MTDGTLWHLRLSFEDGAPALERPLARHPSETAASFAARVALLARVWDGAVRVREGLCRGREPALFVVGPPSTWLDLGRPDATRIARALSSADRVQVAVPAGTRVDRRVLADLPERRGRRPEVLLVDARALETELARARRLVARVRRGPDHVRFELDGARDVVVTVAPLAADPRDEGRG